MSADEVTELLLLSLSLL